MTTVQAEVNYPQQYVQEATVIKDNNLPIIKDNDLPIISQENVIGPKTVDAEAVPQNSDVLKSVPTKGFLSMFRSNKDDNLDLFKNTCLDTEKYALSESEKGMLDDVLDLNKQNKAAFIKDKIKHYCDVKKALSFDPELELKYPKLYIWALYCALTNNETQVDIIIKAFKTLTPSQLHRQDNEMELHPGSAELINELNRELGVGVRIQKRGGTRRKRKITKKNKKQSKKSKRRYRKLKRF